MTNALFADVASRTLRGLLIPYDEMSSPSVSGTEPVMFSKGSVTIPEDVSVLNANRLHSQFAPVARFSKVEDTDAGVVAHFAVATGDDGDALLAEAADPDEAKRPRLSAEVTKLVRSGSRAISSVLTGAAFVPQGAFASAALFSVAPDEADQIKTAVDAAVSEALAKLTAGEQTPEAAPAEGNQKGQFAMTNATIPAGAQTPTKPALTADGLFAAIAHRDYSAMEKYSVSDSQSALFAIENIQHSGTSSKTIGADTEQVGHLGEIWQGNPYQRKFWPLFHSEPLTSYKATGWKWDPANAPEVGSYAGNAAEVNSNAIDTISVTVDALRVAGGNRLDRRFLDFNDQTVIASYFRKLAEHYARYTDDAALAAAVAGAAATDVTGISYPYKSPVGIAGIIDGALAVLADNATPSYAVVSPDLWRDIALTGRDAVLGYLQAGFGLESGSVDGFKIRVGDVGTGKVLVGASQGLQVFELAGSPIRVDALAVHNGAIDGALYGYYATLDSGLGLSIVDTTDYTAPTPDTVIVSGA